MHAFSYANDVDSMAHGATLGPLFDRVRRSIEHGPVNDGMDELYGGLERVRNAMEPDEWQALAAQAREDRAIGELVYQDPLTRRAREKPRGYAGDAVMMDLLYDIHDARHDVAKATTTGRAICGFVRNRPAGCSVRYRREHLAQLIDQIAAAQPQPHVLAIAAGHVREAELSTALAAGRVGRLVALDADAESLREVQTRYGVFGVETVHASVRHILARKADVGRFDFVYAAGLYDYLSDATGAALTARMFELANPGGQVLIPNFAPCCPDRAYLETFMAWDLVYRDEFDMVGLVSRIPSGEIASYDIYSDPSRSIVYLLIRKSAAAAPRA